MRRSYSPLFALWLIFLVALGHLGSFTNKSLAQEAAGFKFVEVKVVDPDGQPMKEVEVNIRIDGMEFPLAVDDAGVVSLNVPAGGKSSVQLGVKVDGYVAQGVNWEPGETVPDEFTIPMKKGFPIGGIVHDEEGKPIEGVKIEGIMSSNQAYGASTSAPSPTAKKELQPYFNGELATTDKEGRWRVNSAPEESLDLQLRFTHADYVSDQGYGYRGGRWEELRSLEKIVVMQEGIKLAGTVTDAAGNPLAGAKLGLGSDYVNQDMIVKTDSEGKYRINNVQPGSNMLTVFGAGHSPDMRTITIEKGMESVDFRLEPGHTIRFHVTDPDGKPVSGVGIAADTWRNCRALMTIADRGSTDAEGTWVWDSAPVDAVQCDLFRQGSMSVRGQVFTAREKAYEITMPPALKVSGSVVDAATGLPLETFSVIQGMYFETNNPQFYWQRYNIKPGQRGQYTMDFSEPTQGHLVRIEAAGYRPGVSRVIKSEEGNVTIDFKMEKGAGPTGIVKLPDGKPAAGAEVLMGQSSNNQLYISNGKNQQQSETIVVTTDAEGKFVLPYPEAEFKLICLDDAGWSEVDGTEESSNLEIVLQPWAKVEGVALRGDDPLPNEQIQLSYSQAYQANRPSAYWSYSTTADGEGKFLFDRVRAGSFTAGLVVSYADRGNGGSMSTFSHSQSVEAKPGETANVQIGGEGRHIKGQMTIPEGYQAAVSWNMGAVQMYEQPFNPIAGAPGFFAAIGRAIAESSNSMAAQAPVASEPQVRRSYAAAFDDEGRFEVFDVVPGTYQLSVTLYEQQTGQNYNWNPIGMLNQTATVPEGSEEEAVDLGKFEMKMAEPTPPMPATGVTGTFQLMPATTPTVPVEQ